MRGKLYAWLRFWGIDYSIGRNNLKAMKWYKSDFSKFKEGLSGKNDFPLGKKWPILNDKFSEGGTMTGHYFHQDLLVAKKLYKNKPIKHVDVGSRVDGFVAHVAVFREIEIFDIRPAVSKVENIKFIQADFTKLSPHLQGYTDSISSLHAIEHFGLGRYNDPIDVDGHLKGLESIYKCLRKGGKFYFSVPVGPQRVEFNAQRVFSIKYLLEIFKDKYKVDNFSFVDDNGDLHENVELTEDNVQSNLGCNCGCGIFEMTKI